MSAPFDHLLRSEFPDILGDMLPGRGVECGDGWVPLLMEMLHQLRWVGEKAGVSIRIGLIKEKLGVLAVQGIKVGEGATEVVQNLVTAIVRQAEARSCTIREECGAFGKRRADLDYIQTLCNEHFTAHRGDQEDDQC